VTPGCWEVLWLVLLCLATQTGHAVLHAAQNLLQSSSATSTVAPPVSSASTLITAATKTPIGDKCGSGRYGIVVSSETTGDEVQICPMCPAGTTGNGDGCTACAAGSASSSVGASSCSTSCTAGTYAQAGEALCVTQHGSAWQISRLLGGSTATLSNICSHAAGSSACLPCPTGTYQDGTSQAECKEW